MKRKIIVIPILMGGLLISSLSMSFGKNIQKVNASSFDASSYYSEISATSGQQLLAQLHDLITSTHTTYSSYNDCKNGDIVEATDPYYEDGVKVEGYLTDFYSGVAIESPWVSGGSTWNREHVWAKSLANNLYNEAGGGSDLHHIRPTDPTANSTRNNRKFGEVSGGTVITGKNGATNGYYVGETFEPYDNKKGDVARIVLYMYAHYNSYANTDIFGNYATTNGTGSASYFTTGDDLAITNIIEATSEDAAFDLLVEWNKSDPVDQIEKDRNNKVYSIQGNRNPFIDNSNYVDAIWGDGTSTNVSVTGVTVSPTTASVEVGKSVTLTHTISPSNATINTVTWSSSNSNVATVSNGVVTGVKEGNTTITVTTTDGGKTATAKITVTASTDVEEEDDPVDETLVSDTLNRAITGITGTTYGEWSGKEGVSGAIYAGQSAGGNESIQLRSDKNNSGIITTTSGGKIRQITVEWNSNTISGRTLNIYGKNIAYSDPTDLYNSSTQGTLLGTIVKGTSTTLNVEGDYEYVGVRSSSKAMYLTSITFSYEKEAAGGKLVVDDTYTSSIPTGVNKYLFTAPDKDVSDKSYIMNPSSGPASFEKLTVDSFSTNKDEYANYYFTLDVSTGGTVAICGDGYCDGTSYDHYYLTGNQEGETFNSQSTWTRVWSYREAYTYGNQDTLTHAPKIFYTGQRGLLYNSEEGAFKNYEVSNDNSRSEIHTGLYLYKVDTAFNMLKQKLTDMNCETMLTDELIDRLNYLYGKLSQKEVALMATTEYTTSEGTFTMAYGYQYALDRYAGGGVSSSNILTKVISNNNYYVVLTIAFLAVSVSLGAIVIKKRKTR